MNDLGNRPIRKFNPGTLQSDEEVIEQFVVREHELDIVLDVLRGNVESSSCQHVLVVAPRGRGKTMLLARVAAELRADDELRGCLLPVRFMEESQEIFNLADFWLETLFHLARESAAQDPEFARELRETHAALTARWREQALEAHARAAVLEAADRLGKKLVLMVENFQGLCENVDEDFGWKLRGVLQSDPQLMLLATATSRFEGLDDAQQPFFELFRIVCLQRLTTDECRRLWQVVSGDTVSEREIRPLEILTGGNPRLLVIVAAFTQYRSLRQLMEELVKLIDEHTEYFRSHMEVLGRTERRVYVAVIDLWQASSTGEIAARARMDVRTVSTMLGRLVDRGAVTVDGSGKKRRYAAERLYSIYYKLRRERDEAAVVQNLIRFMVVFYNEAELAEMSGMLMAEAARSKAIRYGIERVIDELPQVRSFFSGMAQPGVERSTKRFTAIDNKKDERLLQEIFAAFEEDAFEKVIEIVDQFFASQSANWSHVPEPRVAAVSLAKALAHERLGDFEAAIATYDKVVEWCSALDTPEGQVLVASALVNKGVARGELDDFEAALAACEEVIARFGTSEAPEIQVSIAKAWGNKGVARKHLGDFEAMLAACEEVIARFGTSEVPAIQVVVAGAVTDKGVAQGELGDPEAALAACEEVITRFGASEVLEIQVSVARAWVNKGVARRHLGDFEAALAACEEVITRFGASEVPEMQVVVARALLNKGVARDQLGLSEQAIATWDDMIERFGTSKSLEIQEVVATALSCKGMRQTKIGCAEEALHTCEELERRIGTLTGNEAIKFACSAMYVRATALLLQGSHQAAMDEFRSAYAVFDPGNPTIVQGMIRMMQQLVPGLIAAGVSAHDLVEILSSDKAKSDTLLPLVVALRQRAGEVVRAPAEVLEVATDIRARIKAATATETP